MSPRATWRAPGKLVLVGEYGVLDGAGAIVAAVERGVTCTYAPGSLGWTTPGDDRFVRAVLADRAPDAGHFTFTDWNPVDLGGAKPGFGGSAAATVAAVLASGREPQDAFAIHRAVQGGGSGVDVFASLNGGVRRFPDGAPAPTPALCAIWSGKSALTGPRVKQYQAWTARKGFVRDSRALVDGFGVSPVASMREAWRLLRAMARGAGIDYETDEHVAIAALAESFGGAGKPSGAGGGDVAVAVFPDEGARASFEAACSARGLVVIPCPVAEPAGLRGLDGPRVQLVPFTPERLILALTDRLGLAKTLEARVPPSWPQPDYAAVMRVLADRWSYDAGESRWAWLVVADLGQGRELVGEIGGKVGPSYSGELEFGYAIVPEHRRRGLCREAARLFVDWAHEQPGVTRLTAECMEENTASKAVLRGAGLHEHAVRRDGVSVVLRWRE